MPEPRPPPAPARSPCEPPAALPALPAATPSTSCRPGSSSPPRLCRTALRAHPPARPSRPPVLAAAGGTGTYAWSLSSGDLPAGLTLSGLGVISGTPSVAGTTTFTVRATSGGRTATKVLVVTIAVPPLSVATAALNDGVVGAAYSELLAATGGVGGYSWSMAGGSLPVGLALSPAGVIAGTPIAGGATTFTVRVTSGSQQATRALTITVQSPSVSITTTSLPNGTVGQAYGQQLAAIGGDGSYAWTLAGGTLPEGLALSAAGVISGTPAAVGTSSFTVRVASGGQAASLALAITVQLPPVTVITAALPAATLGVAYSQQLGAAGGTGAYTWNLAAGALPPGLVLSATGLLSGTPTAAGTSTFTVRATSGAASGDRELTLVVLVPEVTIATVALPNGTVGQPYNQTLAASGGNGTFAWSVAAGTLPSGLTLSSSGSISGTPSAPGTSTFTVRAASGGREATRQLTIIIGSALPQVIITTASLVPGNVGEPYSAVLLATGGNGLYSWSLIGGTLPAGLDLSASGAISGTPTAAGSAGFTVRAASGDQADTASLSLVIGAALPDVAITTAALPDGTQGALYSQQLNATGGTGEFAWSLTPESNPLPAGLTLSGFGLISGTPTAVGGPTTFTVRAISGSKSASKQLSINIVYPPVQVTTSALADGVVGAAYSQTLTASGGNGTYTWVLAAGSGPLPVGLSLSSAGVISGTPTAAGTSSFTVEASSAGLTASRALSITVVLVLPKVQVTTTTLPGATAGTPYTQQLAATGGNGTYAWTVSAGTPPQGITLSVAGLLSGTAAAAG
ncbi:MAG: hypothetical protein FIB01_09295, partial [Gemmatimonadetes bacterium]|nr:hypothetical protein [Gemmatimonadota bacterium]